MDVDVSYVFLKFINFLHYFIVISYFFLIFVVKYFYDDSKAIEIVKSIDQFYKMMIGLLFIFLSFPYFFNKAILPFYKDDIIKLMFPAGFIILSTINIQDLIKIKSNL